MLFFYKYEYMGIANTTPAFSISHLFCRLSALRIFELPIQTLIISMTTKLNTVEFARGRKGHILPPPLIFAYTCVRAHMCVCACAIFGEFIMRKHEGKLLLTQWNFTVLLRGSKIGPFYLTFVWVSQGDWKLKIFLSGVILCKNLGSNLFLKPLFSNPWENQGDWGDRGN